MNAPLGREASDHTTGVILIVLATLGFAFGDLISKFLVAEIHPVQVNWMRSVVVLILTVPIALRRVGRTLLVTRNLGKQIFRGSMVLASSLLFITGLKSLPLADSTAINYIWPLLVTVLSIPILGENVGIRRWSATIIGFGGMLLIVQPGSNAFQPAIIYPIGAAVLWALASVLTRGLTAGEPPETTIVWSAIVALVGGTLLLPFVWLLPSQTTLMLVGIVGCTSAIAHAMVVFAFERAPASSLAPFTYVQLVWAAILGYLFFNSIPDRFSLLGTLLIVAAGIYTAHRERVRARMAG